MADERVRSQLLTPGPAAAYRATFATGAPEPVDGGDLPPGWEGVYFPFDTPYADLRPDGSPGTGDVVPTVDLPRRMYAGEDTSFAQPLRYGDLVEQRSALGRVARKHGRSGELVFADVARQYLVGGEVAVTSVWHDVFLPATDPAAAPPPPAPLERADWAWSEPLTLDSRQLFRFSALTFNTHRVHYDRTWARDVEGLPDLLVHGPLMRMLLLDFAVRSAGGPGVAAFSVRSLAPAFVDVPGTLVGSPTAEGAEVYALGEAGRPIAQGTVTWAVG